MTEGRKWDGRGPAPLRPDGVPGETTVDSTGKLEAERKRNVDELSLEQLTHSASDLGVEVSESWDKQELIEAIEQGQRLEQTRKNSQPDPSASGNVP